MSTAPVALKAAPLQRRLLAVMKLHVANPWTTLITPWIIFAAIFAATVAIWWAVIAAAGGKDQIEADAFSGNGGGSWVFFFVTVAAIQTMSLTFPFALGMGITRRDYYLGTALYFTGLSLFYALGMALLAGVERATDGWGVDGRFFAPLPVDGTPGWQLFPLYTAILLAFFVFGAVAGAAWVRWKVLGVYLFVSVVVVVIVAAIWGITALDAWTEVGDYVTGHTALTHGMISLPFTVAGAALGYLVIRRAAPRA